MHNVTRSNLTYFGEGYLYAFSGTDIVYDLREEIKWDDMLCMSKPQSMEI